MNLSKCLTEYLLSLAILCACSSSVLGQTSKGVFDPKAAEVLDRNVEVVGGPAAYAKMNTRMSRGKVSLPAFGAAGTFVVCNARPNKSYSRFTIEGFGDLFSGTVGTTAWEISPMSGSRIKTGDERDFAMRWGEFEFDVKWRELYIKADYVGTEAVDGRMCHKIKMTPKRGHPEIHYFDTETYHRLKFSAQIQNSDGPIELAMVFSQFKKVQGFTAPFQVKILIPGFEMVYDVEDTQYNGPIDEKQFELPDSIKEKMPSLSPGGGIEFSIYHGINISHWLSQSSRRGQQRRAWFTQKDVEYLAALGFDHLRLPVDEEQLWDEQGEKESEAFGLLHDAIGWCIENKLKVVIDLHILRSHHFNAKDKPLWTDPAEQEKFLQLWRELSSELKQYPLGMVAYELMNEPVADDADDWNKLVAKAVKEIRKVEPSRKIVIGSNRWQSVNTFDQLAVPEGDRNIILSFHFYNPMLVTHYRASWTGVGKYKGPIHYPGKLVDDKDIADLPDDVAGVVKGNNGVYNRDRLEAMLEKPLRLAKQLDLPLYCGEWGCILSAPRDVRLQWYRDMVSILDEHKIARANWDFKGGFGIKKRDGQGDEDLISILTDR